MKSLRILITSITLLFALSAQALEFTVDNLKYTTNADSTSVTVKNPVVKPVGELVIPSHVTYNGKEYAVTSIGDYAFDTSTEITSVQIPEGVTSIGEHAFDFCIGITSILIPSSVALIESCAFNCCESLTSVNIPESVTSIEESAFYGCISLTSITIPEGVTSIGPFAFSACKKLTSITIPEKVTSIGYRAFEYCESLTLIFIPEGVTVIGESTFANCINLASVNISESVTSIEQNAFYGCNRLISITIPKGVTSIEGGAFEECINLKEIYVENSTPPVLTRGMLKVDKSTCKLYVPIGSKAAYAAANEWKDFDNIEEIDFASVPTSKEIPFMISTDGEGISISGVEPGATITVFTVSGTELLTLPATGDKQRIALSSGEIYIVKVGNQVKKIIL
jgi:hypothetical protein